MKLLAKYKSIDEYYSATIPNCTPQFENLIFIPHNSSTSSEIEVFEHPTCPGHTFVGFGSNNHVSKEDPILEYQYSMTHLDENKLVVNYKSALMLDSTPSEIIKHKMDSFDNLNYQHIESTDNLKSEPRSFKI